MAAASSADPTPRPVTAGSTDSMRISASPGRTYSANALCWSATVTEPAAAPLISAINTVACSRRRATFRSWSR